MENTYAIINYTNGQIYYHGMKISNLISGSSKLNPAGEDTYSSFELAKKNLCDKVRYIISEGRYSNSFVYKNDGYYNSYGELELLDSEVELDAWGYDTQNYFVAECADISDAS